MILIRRKIVTNTERQAGGISKYGPTDRTNVTPCLMKSVCVCATNVLGMKVASKIGTIFTICLVCSTWVTRQTFHSEIGSSVLTAARSRNLLYAFVRKSYNHFIRIFFFFFFHLNIINLESLSRH